MTFRYIHAGQVASYRKRGWACSLLQTGLTGSP